MLLYNLEIERINNQRRAERYLQRLLGSHRSESAVCPPGCQNGCTFTWTANTQSHLNKNVWSSTQHLSPAVDVEVDDRRFWELEAFENSLLVFPPFNNFSSGVLFNITWCCLPSYLDPWKWFIRCGGESGDFYLKDRGWPAAFTQIYSRKLTQI